MARKLALIIGNSEYQDTTLARLVTPSEDVNDLAEVVRAPDIGGFDEVTTLVNESSAHIRLEVESFFADKKPDDLLLLYFSGHGVRDDQGQLYLAVKDTRHNRLRATAIPAVFVTGEMDHSRSRRQVLILDCCHSGAFAQGAKGAPGASVGTASAFEGTGYGRVVLTASDSTQYAWEGEDVVGEADNSVFTHYLIQGLKTGESDTDGDGRITLDELYDYVYEQVVTRTPKQTPGKWSYKQQGEIVIARNPRPIQPKPAALPAELQQTIEDSRPWVREGAVRELDRLLNGRQPGLALAAHEALRRLAEDDSRRVAAAAAQVLAAYTEVQRAKESSEAEARAKEQAARKEVEESARREAEERARREAQAKAEAERLAADRAEQERLARDAERTEAERAERERLAREKAKQEALARERVERLAAQRAEAELLGAQKVEQARLAAEQTEPGRSHLEQPSVQPTLAQRASEAAQPLELRSGLTAFAQTMRLPIVLMALGWGLGAGISSLVVGVLLNSGASPLMITIGWMIASGIGGTATALALRATDTNKVGTPSALIVGSWLVGDAIGAWVFMTYKGTLGIDESNVAGVAVSGAIGGLGTGLALGWARRVTAPQSVIAIVAVWAVAWAVSAVIFLNIANALGDVPSLTLALNIRWVLDYGIADLIDRLFYSSCWGGVSAVAGALGGGVMLWQLRQRQGP